MNLTKIHSVQIWSWHVRLELQVGYKNYESPAEETPPQYVAFRALDGRKIQR